MIEIIREEENGGMTEKCSLPKDIKQMGKPDIGDRIYVENEVYQFLHPYSSMEERRAYVLLGRFENYAGRACVFVEAAIFLEELMYDGELPLWNDGTWAYIYKQLRKEYDDMIIVGWAMDIKGQLPGMTIRLETLHQSHFGGEHQVLLLMDSLEQEEAFYGNRDGHLYRREGFYVYYERKEPAIPVQKQEEMVKEPEDISFSEDAEQNVLPRGTYRRQSMETETAHGIPAYASTVMLALVVCVLGLSAYWNNEKMKSMEATLTQMNQMQEIAAETESSEVKVEKVAGNVAKEEENTQMQVENVPETQAVPEGEMQEIDTAVTTAPAESAEAVSAEQPEAAPTEQTTASAEQSASSFDAMAALTEAQTYLSQGYYTVQQGDSLVGICKKIYQTTAMMDKLCEVNGIENQDEIYAGQKLILPN